MARRLCKIVVGGSPRIISAGAPSGPLPLWIADYNKLPAGPSLAGVWPVTEVPTAPGAGGTLQISRIAVVGPASVPGTGSPKPSGNAMRVELRPYESTPGAADGDVTVDGGGSFNRAEVYGRVPPSMASAPIDTWPDPAGSTRWYGWALLVPDGTQFAADADPWLVLTQWKGRDGGSPPIAVEIKRSGLRLGGARTNSGLIPADGAIGAITTGTWTRLVVGIRFSPASDGWVEVWRDGVQVLAQTNVATMDLINGQPDPIYLKQGIYRGNWTNTTHVLYFGPTTVGTARTDVM